MTDTRRVESVSDRSHSTQTQRPFRMEIIDHDMARVLAEKTNAERLQIGWGMWRSARNMLTRLVAFEHPDWTELKVQREVAKRMSHGT